MHRRLTAVMILIVQFSMCTPFHPSTCHPIYSLMLGRTNLRTTGMFATGDNVNDGGTSDQGFDAAAYESDRLSKDAQAMETMKQIASAEFEKLRTPWKWEIRKRMWDYMEDNDIAQFPRPVHHRIPNFKGAEQAAGRLAQLDEFRNANMIKVNPDTPQRPVRHAVLADGKTLLTPQPRLRTGFFSTIQMATLPNSNVQIEDCTNSVGVAKWGTPVSLNEEYNVDLVVVGSTAVCPTTGARVGKGEGFAELEWGILSEQGNLDAAKTIVVTTVHDCQVVNDIPSDQLTQHDVPVDIIVTPTQVIRVPNRAPKPSGIFWELLSPQKLAQIRVLRQLKNDIEKERGVTLPNGPDEVLPPVASRKGKSPEKGGDAELKKKNNERRRRSGPHGSKEKDRA
jgi:5-formyltetrahydrofolate cyclo-ligase